MATVDQRVRAASIETVSQRLDVELDWQRVSPKYVVVVVVGSAITGAVLTAAGVALAALVGAAWLWVIPAVLAIGTIVQLILAPRRARAIGFVLREDDLVVRRGIAWLRFVAVPYGRMQLIDITRGPIDRVLGLSELRFVTASAASNVRIPGLPEPEAVALRDRLVGLAESRRAGL